ncbi:MAG: phosphoribosylformylglycinamidine synthase subunit PurL [Candidatus Peribacteraceae bacterium]
MNSSAASSAVPTLDFSSMSDGEVKTVLAKYQIGLTADEARKVQEMIGRPPSVVEAVIWGIQGSEHCSYKSSRRFLKTLPTEGEHVILGPKEDAGIVALTDGPPGKRWGIVISHESHNHPSQIVPYEGAATGIGGTVRDVACMGARVLGALDSLRLGDLKTSESKTIAKEVVRGIAGYGNPLGIPNLGGDIVFDAAYNSNCLVNAIAVGLVREDEIIHSYVPKEAAEVGYDVIIVGKPTDRSGFGGAAFASVSMEEEKKDQNSGAVQEPNPFLERHLLASTYALFDWIVTTGNLPHVSFKDLGAGGVVCASVEQVAGPGYGAEIDLDRLHVAVEDLPSEVIACAETQERFCWMCHPDLTQRILDHYNKDWDLPAIAEKARASVIGKVTGDGVYRVRHRGRVVCEAKSRDITSGLLYNRKTEQKVEVRKEPTLSCEGDAIGVEVEGKMHTTSIGEVFKAMVAHPNYASRFPAILHYDKTVIGNSVVEAGEADAGVIAPLGNLEHYVQGGSHTGWEVSEKDRKRGAAFSSDGNSRYGRISPYWQGALAALESMCNVAAVGATPRALTDCLNYGNPEKPAELGALEEGVRGIGDAARGVAIRGAPVPVISGNVSLYNDTPDGGPIPPSAIVCCVGVVEDASKAVSMQCTKEGSLLLYIGEPKDECGGSAYYQVLEEITGAARDVLLGAHVPKPDFPVIGRMMECVRDLIGGGSVRSCHDVSEGGMLLALFEMLLPRRKVSRGFGVEVELHNFPGSLRTDTLLFTQTPAFIIEVEQELRDAVERLCKEHNVPVHALGTVTNDGTMRVRHGALTLQWEMAEMHRIWEQGLIKAWETQQ